MDSESIGSDQDEYERIQREAQVMGGESISSDQKQYERMKREQEAKRAVLNANDEFDSSMLDISSDKESELSDVDIYSLYDKRYFAAEPESAEKLA